MNDIKTVADKIRAMKDDELIELLSQTAFEGYKNGIVHAKRFKKSVVSYEMIVKANKTLLSKNVDEVSFGPLPGMGLQ